ncbi:hypothetical protein [Mycolicibacterium sp.]
MTHERPAGLSTHRTTAELASADRWAMTTGFASTPWLGPTVEE